MSGELMVIGEGKGEVEAAGRLVAKVVKAQGHFPDPFRSVPSPLRLSVLGPGALERACDIARGQRPAALLITSDFEDLCPKAHAPAFAQRIRNQNLPFPAALVLFYREYETLFISVAGVLAGSTITLPSAPHVLSASPPAVANPESHRDAKAWVRAHLMNGVPYKPTTHQRPLTDALDVKALREAGLSSFRRLDRAVDHLAQHVAAGTTAVYP